MLTSVIVPVFNEEESVQKVVNEIKKLKIKKEIIVIDDGSTDNSYSIIKGIRGIKMIRHKKNLGKGCALRTGFNASHGDIIATIDADSTYPVNAIQKIVKQLGGSDIVIGSRFLKKNSSMSHIRYLGNSFFSFLISTFSGRKITDSSSGLRAFRKELLNDIDVRSSGLSWEVEMTSKSLAKKKIIKEIPIEYHDRSGKSKLKAFRDGMFFLYYILKSFLTFK